MIVLERFYWGGGWVLVVGEKEGLFLFGSFDGDLQSQL